MSIVYEFEKCEEKKTIRNFRITIWVRKSSLNSNANHIISWSSEQIFYEVVILFWGTFWKVIAWGLFWALKYSTISAYFSILELALK